jgi:hypothetical protein
VKDLIGEWHDWETLIDAATGVVAEHGRACMLLRRMRSIGDRKYHRALTATLRLRATLRSRVRDSRKSKGVVSAILTLAA